MQHPATMMVLLSCWRYSNCVLFGNRGAESFVEERRRAARKRTPCLERCLGYNVNRDGHRGFPPTHWPLGGPQAPATPHPIPIIFSKA